MIRQKNEILQAALGYAARGIPVFPCRGKAPATPNGFKDASIDKTQVEEWFSNGKCNIGIPTGAASGLWVLDLDGSEGVVAFKYMQNEHGNVPETPYSILLTLLSVPRMAESAKTLNVPESDLQWFENLTVAEQDSRLRSSLVEWQQIVSCVDSTANGVGGDKAAPFIPICTKVSTDWRDSQDQYTLPAGSPGWLCLNPNAEIDDPWMRRLVQDGLRRKAYSGNPALAVWLGGKPRVIERRYIQIGDGGHRAA